jgi:hypothetical protein
MLLPKRKSKSDVEHLNRSGRLRLQAKSSSHFASQLPLHTEISTSHSSQLMTGDPQYLISPQKNKILNTQGQPVVSLLPPGTAVGAKGSYIGFGPPGFPPCLFEFGNGFCWGGMK